MTQALFASINQAFENHAPGKVYLFPYPAADPGGATPTNTTRIDASLADIFGEDATFHTISAKAWGDVDENGLNADVKNDTIEFPHNDGSAPGSVPGAIKSATLEFAIYDCDAAHIADMMGLAAADLLTIAATATTAGRQAALLAVPDASQKWMVIYVAQSATPGEWDLYVWPRCNFTNAPAIKYSVKDKLSMKCQMACNPDLFLVDSRGRGVFSVPITVNAPVA